MKSYKQFLLGREFAVNDNSLINEMANISKTRTGLACKIFISTSHGVNHGPRIKVNRSYNDKWSGDSFTVTISNNPLVIGSTTEIKQSDIDNIKDWVQLNQDLLFKYWKNEIDSGDFIDQIKTL